MPPTEPYWVSFIADRETGAIFAALGLAHEEGEPNEQRRVEFSPIAFYYSMDEEPFESVLGVAYNEPALAAFNALCAQASGETDRIDAMRGKVFVPTGSDPRKYSLSFVLAAWEAEQIANTLEPSPTEVAESAEDLSANKSRGSMRV